MLGCCAVSSPLAKGRNWGVEEWVGPEAGKPQGSDSGSLECGAVWI